MSARLFGNTDVTFIVGPNEKTNADILRVIKMAINPGSRISVAAIDRAVDGVYGLYRSSGMELGQLIAEALEKLEKVGQRPFHLIVGGQIDQREVRKIAHQHPISTVAIQDESEIAVIAIHSQVELHTWDGNRHRISKPDAGGDFHHRVAIIDQSCQFGDQVERIVAFLPVREKVRGSLMHNVTRDRHHPVRQIIDSHSRRQLEAVGN